MLQPIYLPEEIEVQELDTNTTEFSISPYHPGYGPTTGNALRRVLLSSLPGSAITYMRLVGVDHEFSAIEGVKEDVVSIMLNLKRVSVASTSTEPVEIRLSVTGEKKVTAGDFETPPEVTIANPDQIIANLTSTKAKLELIISITTDGSIAPKEALSQAASILADHFSELTGDFVDRLTGARPQIEEEPEAIEAEPIAENTLNLLQLPSRVHNALERVGITTAEQVAELSDEQIQDIPGLGAKAIADIHTARADYRRKMGMDDTVTSDDKE